MRNNTPYQKIYEEKQYDTRYYDRRLETYNTVNQNLNIYIRPNLKLFKKYRPVSVLPVAYKIYQRYTKKQISEYIDNHLSPHLCGYRKGYITLTALISMLEKWKLSKDNKGFAGAILMGLNKTSDTLNHPLLLAKLHVHGYSKQALAIICSYLPNRKQWMKINTVINSWKYLILHVPQESVLVLFNTYLNDLFLFLKYVGI